FEFPPSSENIEFVVPSEEEFSRLPIPGVFPPSPSRHGRLSRLSSPVPTFGAAPQVEIQPFVLNPSPSSAQQQQSPRRYPIPSLNLPRLPTPPPVHIPYERQPTPPPAPIRPSESLSSFFPAGVQPREIPPSRAPYVQENANFPREDFDRLWNLGYQGGQAALDEEAFRFNQSMQQRGIQSLLSGRYRPFAV